MIPTFEFLRAQAVTLPLLAKFAIAMAVIVGIPPLARRAHFPVVVGLLLTGVVTGPHGLDVAGQNRPVAEFFAELGALLLMFFAGLEIDLIQFRQTQRKTIIFGLWTTGPPLLLGTAVGFLFGYKPVAAVVLGSLLASHALLGLPIVTGLGIARLEPVTITVGVTVISDTLSLIVFAICVPTWETGFSLTGLVEQLIEIAIFVPLILLGLSRLGAYLLSKVEDDEDAYFILMLAILALAGTLATSINLPGIVGAFLAGLAINTAAQTRPAKEKLEFFGNSFLHPDLFSRDRVSDRSSRILRQHNHQFSLSRGRYRSVAARKVDRSGDRGASIRLFSCGAQHHGVAYLAAGGRDSCSSTGRLHYVRLGGAASDRYRAAQCGSRLSAHHGDPRTDPDGVLCPPHDRRGRNLGAHNSRSSASLTK